jgi:hypothetical protein
MMIPYPCSREISDDLANRRFGRDVYTLGRLVEDDDLERTAEELPPRPLSVDSLPKALRLG